MRHRMLFSWVSILLQVEYSWHVHFVSNARFILKSVHIELYGRRYMIVMNYYARYMNDNITINISP